MWILIVLSLAYPGAAPAHSVTFKTEAQCKVAAQWINAAQPGYTESKYAAQCFRAD